MGNEEGGDSGTGTTIGWQRQPQGTPGDAQARADWLVGGGELGELIRATDWTGTPLGARHLWPQSLRTAVNLVIESQFPKALLWGADLILLYNDAYRVIAADKHPRALGRSTREVWPEVWHINQPIFAAVMQRGEAVYFEDMLFPIDRRGRRQDAFFTICYSPVRDENGCVAGTLVTLLETTRVVDERRMLAAECEHAVAELRLRKSEERLRASEERHRLALAAGQMATWDWHVPSGEVVWNDEHFLMLGYQPGAVQPSYQAWAVRIHPDDRAAIESLVQDSLARGGEYRAEFRVLWPNRTVHWVEARGRVEHDGDGRLARQYGVMLDITERKQAEQALLAEKTLLRDVIETIADPIYVKDAESRHVLDNTATLEVTSKRLDQIIGHTDREFLDDPAAAEAILEHDRQVMESGTVHVFEETVPTPRGARILLNTKAPRRDATGRVVGLVGVARDITDSKRAEQERARAAAELEAMFEAMTDGIAVFDTTGHVVRTNETARRIFGTDLVGSDVNVLTRHLSSRQPGSGPIAIEDYPTSRALRGERVVGDQLALANADGRETVVEASATPLRVGSEVIGAVTAWHDISDLVHAREALEEADRRKNQFLAVLSHELRNPLAPITNSLYILDRAPAGGEQAQRAKEVIARQVAHLSAMVNDLLDLTRISRNKIQLHKQRLDLNEVVRRAVEDQRFSFEQAEIGLELTTPACAVPVLADRTRVAQVIGNVLHNSAKFTPAGGRARVSVDVEASTVVVRVADDGVGMAPETLAGLFQPFMQADHTLDRTKGGLGLGLALVKDLVALHGGSVVAHSEGLGKGTAIVVRLPMDTGATVNAAAAVNDSASARLRILIIEDNVDAAESLRELLELDQHEVELAHEGPTGIAKARAFRPEVVLCDIGLPGMDGFAVARALRADESLAGAYLVALTGYALPEDLQRAAEAGFHQHLAKPPSLQKLTRVLADRGGQRP